MGIASEETGRLSDKEMDEAVHFDAPEKTTRALLTLVDRLVDAFTALDDDGVGAANFAAALAKLKKLKLTV